MFTDNVVLKTSVHGAGYCEESEKDRCFLFLRKWWKKNCMQALGMMEFALSRCGEIGPK